MEKGVCSIAGFRLRHGRVRQSKGREKIGPSGNRQQEPAPLGKKPLGRHTLVKLDSRSTLCLAQLAGSTVCFC